MSSSDNLPIVIDSSILIPWSLVGKTELLVSVGDMFTTDSFMTSMRSLN